MSLTAVLTKSAKISWLAMNLVGFSQQKVATVVVVLALWRCFLCAGGGLGLARAIDRGVWFVFGVEGGVEGSCTNGLGTLNSQP